MRSVLLLLLLLPAVAQGRKVAIQQVGTLDVSAASGLVVKDRRLHVVADDQHELATYGARGGVRRGSTRLFPGRLPRDAEARKQAKPDLEALIKLPRLGMLALGSGSKAQRNRGAWLPSGAPGPVHEVDLRPLYRWLEPRVGRVNIEGGAAVAGRLYLVQRGGKSGRKNALITLDLAGVKRALLEKRALGPELVRSFKLVELGRLGGVALGFTDVSPISGGQLLFSAAAENTSDPRLDGRVTGSALGILDAQGKVIALRPLQGRYKVEGVHAFRSGRALLVADADDPSQAAPLLETRWNILRR